MINLSYNLHQGSWGGTGVKKSAPKPHLVKKVAGIDPKSRSDYGKAHVIISEKRDKKAAKYAVKDLPYPYTSKAQFEARMSAPIGIEWNTRLSFQRNTLPRVVKKVSLFVYQFMNRNLISFSRWVPLLSRWKNCNITNLSQTLFYPKNIWIHQIVYMLLLFLCSYFFSTYFFLHFCCCTIINVANHSIVAFFVHVYYINL